MQAYHVDPQARTIRLSPSVVRAPLAADEVRVRVRAVALNYRDLMVVEGRYHTPSGPAMAPCSDAAGEILECGSQAGGWQPGDRVLTSFFPDWREGPIAASKVARAPGGNADGVLAEEIVVPAAALVRMPSNLGFAQAATLTCAGVTAWNALFVEGRLAVGDTVLLLGTGGVSTWGLQLATAAGLRAIVTSSSDAKLERARALGAAATINYAATPDWHEEARRLTGGRGVDLVLEVGGEGTLARSIAATAQGGTVAIVGGVSGGFGATLDLLSLVTGAKRLAGISVGSRAMLEALARTVEQLGIEPVVDRTFDFTDAPAAFRYLRDGRHVGKVVILG